MGSEYFGSRSDQVVACDKRLHRLISYIHNTQDWVLTSMVGDKPEDCKIAAFCDASFVAELRDSKSSTGGYVSIVGPRTFVPIIWPCKKQGATSHSSTEAEVISMEAVMRCEAIPALILWELVIEVMAPNGKQAQKSNPSMGKFKMEGMVLDIDSNLTTLDKPLGRAKLAVLEDNDAVIKMTVKGRTPAMRHIQRTHRVDIDWLFERFQSDPGIYIRYVNAKQQVADLLTKGTFTAIQWNVLCDLAQVGPPGVRKEPAVINAGGDSSQKPTTNTKSEGDTSATTAGGNSLHGDTSAVNAGGDSKQVARRARRVRTRSNKQRLAHAVCKATEEDSNIYIYI